jgi:hypothetical protein
MFMENKYVVNDPIIKNNRAQNTVNSLPIMYLNVHERLTVSSPTARQSLKVFPCIGSGSNNRPYSWMSGIPL